MLSVPHIADLFVLIPACCIHFHIFFDSIRIVSSRSGCLVCMITFAVSFEFSFVYLFLVANAIIVPTNALIHVDCHSDHCLSVHSSCLRHFMCSVNAFSSFAYGDQLFILYCLVPPQQSVFNQSSALAFIIDQFARFSGCVWSSVLHVITFSCGHLSPPPVV